MSASNFCTEQSDYPISPALLYEYSKRFPSCITLCQIYYNLRSKDAPPSYDQTLRANTRRANASICAIISLLSCRFVCHSGSCPLGGRLLFECRESKCLGRRGQRQEDQTDEDLQRPHDRTTGREHTTKASPDWPLAHFTRPSSNCHGFVTC